MHGFQWAIGIKIYNFSQSNNKFVKKSLIALTIWQNEVKNFNRFTRKTKYQNTPDICMKDQISI